VYVQIGNMVLRLRRLAGGSIPARAELLLGLGSAPGWLDAGLDFACAHPDSLFMAVNDAIADWPLHLDFAGSYHAAMLAEMRPGRKPLPWLACRKGANFPTPDWVVAEAPHHGVTLRLEISGLPIASSGILPVLVGKALHIKAVVLAGVELSGSYGERYLEVWRKAAAQGLLEGVYTLSGGPLRDLGLLPLWPGNVPVSPSSLPTPGRDAGHAPAGQTSQEAAA
jgi:hypothetical protein